jgi:hypothetical protein
MSESGAHCCPEPIGRHVRSWRKRTLHRHRNVVRKGQRIAELEAEIDALQRQALAQPMREILRIMERLSGELDLEICIEPRPNYGRTKPQTRDRGRLGWSYSWSNELLSVRSDVPLSRAGEALQASVRNVLSSRPCPQFFVAL